MSIKTFSCTAAEFHSWIIISEEMHSVYRQIGSYSTQLKRGWSRYITQGSRLTCWIGSKSMHVSHLSHTGILIELCHVRLQLQVQSPSIDSKSVLNSGRFPPLYITSWSLAYVEFGKRSTPYVCFFVFEAVPTISCQRTHFAKLPRSDTLFWAIYGIQVPVVSR